MKRQQLLLPLIALSLLITSCGGTRSNSPIDTNNQTSPPSGNSTAISLTSSEESELKRLRLACQDIQNREENYNSNQLSPSDIICGEYEAYKSRLREKYGLSQ
jgi:hypothetical protein